MKRTEVLVFDFDGVLAESLELMGGMIRQIAKEMGFDPLENLSLEEIKEKGAAEMVKLSGISPFQLAILMKRGRIQMANYGRLSQSQR